MATLDTIPVLLSRFITERDNFIGRFKMRESGLTAVSSGGPMAFSELINKHAVELAAILPAMNLAEWEALSELASSRLAQMRMLNVSGL